MPPKDEHCFQAEKLKLKQLTLSKIIPVTGRGGI
jgi:hypothetical protein